MKIKRRVDLTKYRRLIFAILFLLVTLFLSIGYSAYNNSLSIDNIGASVRIDKDIRIMGITLDEASDGYSYYQEYNYNSINTKVNLESENSYIIYNVDVYNLGNVPMAIKDITYDSDVLNVELLGYNLKDKICENNVCSLGIKKTIKLKVSYKDGKYDKDNTIFDLKVDFNFKGFYSVTYINIDDTVLPKEVMEEDTLKVALSMESSDVLKIVMNKVTLTSSDYSYTNNILEIPNVSGDIIISLNSSTPMKDSLILANSPAGDGSDLPSYDLDNMTEEERANKFGNIASESGLFKTKGITGKDVYFFRGDVSNNYVLFGGYLWRILQIDESGNLRIIFEGSVGRSVFNETSTIANPEAAETVLGFNNSTAQSTLNTWFKFLENFSSRIITSKFCANFDYVSKVSSSSKNQTNYFKSYQNVGNDIANYTPSLECPDEYTFEEEVGLISAEEYVLAGGAFEKNNTSFFLYNSSIYTTEANTTDFFWTLSPAYNDEGRKDGNVFMIDKNGALKDWSTKLYTGNYLLRPVITISGDYNMTGNGTITNPYSYGDLYDTATKFDVTDLSLLSNNTYYIGHILGKKNIDGLLSSTVSTKLNSKGLLGKDTAVFSSDKLSVINKLATEFIFADGTPVSDDASDGYYYYIKTINDEYLKINEDTSVELTTTPTRLKVKLCTLTNRSGQIVISNEDETMYLNFYGGASNEGDDKFAGWNEIDDNVGMVLYKLNK